MLYESNWRAASAYTYLDVLGSPAFAWEFLRRNPDYQAVYRSIASTDDPTPEMPEPLAQRWGLRFAAPPDLRADRAHVVWLPHLYPTSVIVVPAPDEFKDARPIGDLTPASSRRGTNGEHWLLDCDGEALPVALIDGADSTTPAAALIPLDADVPTRVEALLLLWQKLMGGAHNRVPDGLTAQQRSRLKLVLRGLDGQLASCSQRTIAEVLFDKTGIPSGFDWNDHPLRYRARRLCKRGLDLMHHEYLDLVCHPRKFGA